MTDYCPTCGRPRLKNQGNHPLEGSMRQIAEMFAADIRGVMESMANRLQWIAEGEV